MGHWAEAVAAVVLMLCVLITHGDCVKVLNKNDKTIYNHCGSLLKAGYNESGIYFLKTNNHSALMPCKFKDGTAYTLILRRLSRSISFQRTWHEYEYGFGRPDDNYWAGLSLIYSLGHAQLHIVMQDWFGNIKESRYKDFYLSNRRNRYALHVDHYFGTPIDDLSFNNNMPFSTYDAPDPYGCAEKMKAGWWYNYCTYTLPTGVYYIGGKYKPMGGMYDGMFWKDWYGYEYSLKFFSMSLVH